MVTPVNRYRQVAMTVRPKTKAPAPKAKLANPRNEALARMGKAELLKTVKTLDLRVTKLLNQLARKSDLVATDNVVWLKNAQGLDGVMMLCARDEVGAVGFVPLSPQQYVASKPPIHGATKNRMERLAVTQPDKRLPTVSPVVHNGTLDELPGNTETAAPTFNDGPIAGYAKFPWEQ